MKIINKNSQQTIFQQMMQHRTNNIQRILLHLTCNFDSKDITEYKAKALHQYVYFCSKIVPFLVEDFCDSVVGYFVKDITYSLLYFANQEDTFITKISCTYLYSFLKSLLPTRSVNVGSILNKCLKTLAPKIKKKNENSKVMDVLVLLLTENSKLLGEAIENLGSLPNFFSSKDFPNQESQVTDLKF